MKKWANQVDTQRRIWKDHARSSSSTKQSSASATEFTYMRDQVQLENPYREDDDDGDENDDLDTVVPGYLGLQDNYTVGQRSRSATGESGPPMSDLDSRVPPPRFPMGYTSQPSLTLRTQQLQGAAGTPQADSYFSPAAESPISSRTSSSSAGMFPFPRQQPPLNG